jgi:Ca-activated chloride channel family protein
MLRALTLFLIASGAVVCVTSSTTRADGFIVISDTSATAPTPGHFRFSPLSVTYHRVTVEMNDQVATTSVDQEFYNPTSQRLEGTYLFPLPVGAHVDKFSMDVNGTMTDAELLDASKARSVYEDIVRKFKDPALLEYTGRDAFRARIFPIEPNSRKHVKITYTQLLKSDSGSVEYTYPLNTEKFSSRPLENVSVRMNVSCKDPIKSLYSPSHNVEIRRDGENKATAGYEERNVRPDTDFKLVVNRSKSAVGIDLLTYRTGSDDGYFMLLASAGVDAIPANQLQKRDVCFVIDTSGSMAEANGKKMEQARKALSFCLQNLNEGDRFEIVRFSTEAETLFGGLKDANKENVAKAQAFVQSLKPIGGTAISDALSKALSLRPRLELQDRIGGRPAMPFVVIFLTDGQPTIGETNEDKLVESTRSQIGHPDAPVRIFSFGIGTDVNTHLLDRIASETKAFSQYVLPEEDLEVKLSGFYTKVSQPVLSNVELRVVRPEEKDAIGPTRGLCDINVSQVYPGHIPDLYRGEMVVAFGRYKGKGQAAVQITGTLNGETKAYSAVCEFADRDTSRPFIPQLWATRRVGWLLDEIRLHGESPELRDEVTRLAREHGIVTPYTSYLIIEDERRRSVPVAMQTMSELSRDDVAAPQAAAKYASARREAEAPAERAGAAAVENAKDLADLKYRQNGQQAQAQGARLAKRTPATSTTPGRGAGASFGYRESQNYAQQARVVNGRAFYQNGSRWTDATAQTRGPSLKQKQITFNSEEYFVLLSKHSEAAQWLSLGNELDVVLDDTLYQIR